MAQELKRYCYISKFIEKTDQALWNVLDEICILTALRPKRGYAGITFIYPSPEVVKQLVDLSNTDKLEKAIEIVLDHIVHYYIDSPEKWQEYSDDIPNGHMKKADVKVARNAVTYEGVKIVHDTSFRQFVPSGHPPNQAIWRIEGKGTIAHRADAAPSAAPHARTLTSIEVKKGGFITTVKSKTEFMWGLIDQYVGAVFHGDGSQVKTHIFERLCSLLLYLKNKHNAVYLGLVQYLTPLPVATTVFLLSNISDSVFMAWQKTGQIPIDNAVSRYHDLLFEAASECKSDKAAEIVAAPFDGTKSNYHIKILEYFDKLASSRGGQISGVALFGYLFGCFREEQALIPAEGEILALRRKGLRSQSAPNFHKDTCEIVDIVTDRSPFALSPDMARMDPDATANLVSVFRHTDLWGWHACGLVKTDSYPKFGSLNLRSESDDVISTVYHVMSHNKAVYFEETKDTSMVVSQLAGLGAERWAALRAEVDASLAPKLD